MQEGMRLWGYKRSVAEHVLQDKDYVSNMMNPNQSFEKPLFIRHIFELGNKKHMVEEDKGKKLVSKTSFHCYTIEANWSEQKRSGPEEEIPYVLLTTM